MAPHHLRSPSRPPPHISSTVIAPQSSTAGYPLTRQDGISELISADPSCLTRQINPLRWQTGVCYSNSFSRERSSSGDIPSFFDGLTNDRTRGFIFWDTCFLQTTISSITESCPASSIEMLYNKPNTRFSSEIVSSSRIQQEKFTRLIFFSPQSQDQHTRSLILR